MKNISQKCVHYILTKYFLLELSAFYTTVSLLIFMLHYQSELTSSHPAITSETVYIIGVSLSEPQFSDADGTFVHVYEICLNLHNGRTANMLTYLFQQHVHAVKIIPH